MPFFVKLLIFISANVLLSLVMIEVEAFEWFFEYSRAHEDWDLDEYAMVAVAILLVGATWAVAESFRLMKELKAEHKVRLESERKLGELRRIEVLSTLSAGIAHTGNNLLQPIMSLSRVGRRQLGPDHEVSGHLEKIEQAASDAAQLFSDVLKLGEDDDSEGHVDAADFIRRNQSLFRVVVPRGVDLQVHVDVSEAVVGLSGARLIDAILTLLSNSVDALNGRRGVVAVSIKRADTEDHIVLSVRDTGRGIAERDLERVFDPFFTRKQSGRGTGLGLSMIKTMVENANGKVVIESAVGQGTRVAMILPVQNAPDAEVTA